MSQSVIIFKKIIEVFQRYLKLAKAELKEDILRPIRYILFIFASLIFGFPGFILLSLALCLYLNRFWHNLALVCAVVGLGILLAGVGLAYFFCRQLSRKMTFLKVTRENLHHLLSGGPKGGST